MLHLDHAFDNVTYQKHQVGFRNPTRHFAKRKCKFDIYAVIPRYLRC